MSNYYHSLKPFRELFQTGIPVLTYHKLGPRPFSAKLKGLYVSEKLFTRQLAELREAEFSTPPLAEMFPIRENFQKQIVITFDDGCSNVLCHGLKSLVENKFHAIQFLVTDLLGKTNEWDAANGEAPEPLMDIAQVREWLAAGNEIGSHSLTHRYLTRIPLAQAREEIFASKTKLENLFGRPIDHFCYPYGDWNESIRDLVVEAGYKTAFTTIRGINKPGESPFTLKRFTARYPSRNWKTIWAQLRGKI